MLPTNIITRWSETGEDLDRLKSALTEYLRDPQILSSSSGDFILLWRERTLLTFGDSVWSSTEGSLLFENQRAIMGVNNPYNGEKNYLIFTALLDESISLLQSNVAHLFEQREIPPLRSSEFELGNVAGQWLHTASNDIDIIGMDMLNKLGERLLFSGRHNMPTSALFSHYSSDDMRHFEDNRRDFFVSQINLRLAKYRTVLALSRNGTLTFCNPQMPLEEMWAIISQVIKILHSRSSRASERRGRAVFEEGVG